MRSCRAGERSYHIFYQLLTETALTTRWKLPTAKELRCLSHKGEVATLQGVSDAKEFALVRRALDGFGLSRSEQECLAPDGRSGRTFVSCDHFS